MSSIIIIQMHTLTHTRAHTHKQAGKQEGSSVGAAFINSLRAEVGNAAIAMVTATLVQEWKVKLILNLNI